MAGILTATMLGLVYLTQTLASNATSLEITRLANQSQSLHEQLLRQSTKVQITVNEDAIAREARKLGLQQLDDPIVLKAP